MAITDTPQEEVPGFNSAQENVRGAVKALLVIQGKRARDLADALGVSESTASKLVNGPQRWSLDHLCNAARFFDRPYDDLLEGGADRIWDEVPDGEAKRLLRSRCFAESDLATVFSDSDLVLAQ